jgi:hypothetical protein
MYLLSGSTVTLKLAFTAHAWSCGIVTPVITMRIVASLPAMPTVAATFMSFMSEKQPIQSFMPGETFFISADDAWPRPDCMKFWSFM